MKLLYVIGSLEVGGAEQHLLRVAAEMCRLGYRPEVFAFTVGGPLTQRFIDAGIPVHGATLPTCLAALLRHKRAIAWAGLLMSSLALWRLCWKRRPQVIHFFLPAAYIAGGVVSLFGPPGMRRIMSRRSLNLYQTKHRLFRRVEHWLHPKMQYICGNSKAVVENLLSEGVREDQLCLIYNGIDVHRFHEVRSRAVVRDQLSIADGELVFIVVANLIPYKGHADLIEAFGRIKDRLPAQWTCLLVGRDDGIGSTLRAQADELGVADRLRFLGSRQDVPDLLAAADIGILCSHEEGFSNAVLEGMAAALPMVVTDVGGNAEAVVHGSTGLVVPPHAPARLADALLSMVAESERIQMGQAGRGRVEMVFSMAACIQGYVDLYSG